MDQQRGLTPIEELNRLDAEVARATEFAQLKPLFERISELGRENPADFELQLAVSDVKQRLFLKGKHLKEGVPTEGEPPDLEPAAPPAGPEPESEFPATPEPPPEPAAPPPAPPTGPAPPPAKPPAQPKAAKDGSRHPYGVGSRAWRKTIYIGVSIGLVASIILWVSLVQLARNRNADSGGDAPAGTYRVDIATVPPGAAIQINGESKCTSNCRVNLPPGNYQVAALLDGYDPVASAFTVTPGAPVSVSLPLQPQAQTVRILTDFEAGQVTLDGQKAGDLVDGQYLLERVPNGTHTLHIAGKGGETQFQFELSGGKPPRVAVPAASRDLVTVLVASLGNQAYVQTNTPKKVALGAQPQGETGAEPLQLKNITAGNHDLTVGEGPGGKSMVVTFGPSPLLTAYVKSDVNTGTLVVSTGEDDVTVWVNGREQRRKTQRGQLRVMALGDVTVRVAKEGFLAVSDMKTTVNRGEEKRLEFKLTPLPQVASLIVRGAVPGTSVFLGDRNLGVTATDGTMSAGNLPPGDHTVELRRQGFANKRLTRTFRAGDTVILTGADVALAPNTATLNLTLNPPDTQVVYRHGDEQQARAAQGATLRLEAGTYTFTARAPGHADRTEKVQIAAGETRALDLTLQRSAQAVKPAVAAGPDWSKSGWTLDEGVWTRRGGNYVVVRNGPLSGVISFTAELRKGGNVFRGGRIRWFADFTDSKNYALFEMDKKNFNVKSVREGRSTDRDRTAHNAGDLKSVEIQVEISKDRIVNRMRSGQQWIVLDTLTEPGQDFTQGGFGFLVPGNDEIGISNFRFSPR